MFYYLSTLGSTLGNYEMRILFPVCNTTKLLPLVLVLLLGWLIKVLIYVFCPFCSSFFLLFPFHGIDLALESLVLVAFSSLCKMLSIQYFKRPP